MPIHLTIDEARRALTRQIGRIGRSYHSQAIQLVEFCRQIELVTMAREYPDDQQTLA